MLVSVVDGNLTVAIPTAMKNSINIGSMVSAILFYWLGLAVSVANYLLVTIPRIAVIILQTSFSVNVTVSLVLIYMALTLSLSIYIVRHKYLTRYSANSVPPKQEKLPQKYNLALDYVMNTKKRSRESNGNYLDEFLSAIKVFGYLERPVFNELTKNMTTQKLAPDEILYLDEKLGFSIVVEGVLQVYTKIKDGRNGPTVELGMNDETVAKDDFILIGTQRYQLLNEVKSGLPLSSLLSTLDLFRSPSTLGNSTLEVSGKAIRPEGTNANFNFGPFAGSNLVEPQASPMLAFRGTGLEMPTSGPISPILGSASTPDNPSFLPDIIARPKNDPELTSSATIAIIPALAFRRVHSKFPKATSHIVTMVLNRLYKVTMNAVHNYLELTKEFFETEISLNEKHQGDFELPSYLFDGVVEKLRNTISDNSTSTCIYSRTTKKVRKISKEVSSKYVVLASRSKLSHPGDLLSSVPLSRRPDLQTGPSYTEMPLASNLQLRFEAAHRTSSKSSMPLLNDRFFSDEREETEETSLRLAVIENIFKLLGIDDETASMDANALLRQMLLTSSSVVGLSALVNDKLSGHERYLFNLYFDGDRMGSSYSVKLDIGTRGSNSAQEKFYNTIHQTMKTGDFLSAASPLPHPENRKNSSNAELNFTSIKSAFSKQMEIRYFQPGTVITSESSSDTGLFYVIDGSLDVLLELNSDDGTRSYHKLYTARRGGIAGYMSCLVGYKSLVTIRSSKVNGAIVAHLSKNDFVKLMDKYYFLQLPVAAKMKSLLPPLISTIDFALEWCHIPAGEVLCSQGDMANGFHIVLSGRFRVVRYKNGPQPVKKDKNNLIDDTNSPHRPSDGLDYEILGEYGHGLSVGEVEVLTASRRTDSLIAIRDSETARIPRSLFEMLTMQNPSIMVKVSRVVANRVLQKSEREQVASLVATDGSSRLTEVDSEYKTLTILPSVSGLPVKEFADRLVQSLRGIGRKVIALDQALTLTHLGKNAFDERLAHLKLLGYFAYLEEEYETVVYVCDTPVKSRWTSTCMSQGDCILLLADAEDDECATNAGEYERLLLKLKTTARTELCLIHSDKYVIPGSTSIWLNTRLWVQGHHHIHMEIPKTVTSKEAKRKANIIQELAAKLSSKANPYIKVKFENVKLKAIASLIKLNQRVNKVDPSLATHKDDFLRLARILSNEAVGLVLGGGGSRGISHVGVVTALEKHGIPVDMVGGTSIGSFVGGLYAKDHNIVSIYGMTKKFAKRIGSFWRFLFDLTYPSTSYITGHEFNRGIWKAFGYYEIEDFWLRYFCNSTNITNSTMEIHETGYAWRFIRASMSLAGLLPPITFKGSMLLDGGYIDNLPVLEMKKRGAKYIIAVDVGSMDDRTPMSYGDTLSGFWVVFNRFNPFSKHPDVPNMMEVQLRLAYVASVNALELAKRTLGVIYMRPPIDDYATLDFMKFDEIYEIGLSYADRLLKKWEEEGKLPKFAGLAESRSARIGDRLRVNRRNSI